MAKSLARALHRVRDLHQRSFRYHLASSTHARSAFSHLYTYTMYFANSTPFLQTESDAIQQIVAKKEKKGNAILLQVHQRADFISHRGILLLVH